ncbi:MAG TPA: hypothetical protein VE975_05085 [Actinomycetota bacterium]|nr:hypothetical protein [Actinomycetota bacterium]
MTILLEAGDAAAAIEPALGGRISSLVVAGGERLVGPPADRQELIGTSWGLFPMAPWPGRLEHGRFAFRNEVYSVRRNHGRHSIHGVVFDAAWEVAAATATTCALRCPLGPRWPLGGEAVQRIEIDEEGISLRLDVTAIEAPMPAACGWHPWFARPPQSDLEVCVRSTRVLVLDRDLIPTGEVREANEDEDLTGCPALGDRRLDTVYANAASPVTVRWPDLELVMSLDHPLQTVVVFTPAGAACVEPQSAWPNFPALREAHPEAGGAGLELGETLSLSVRMEWRLS